MSFLIYLAAFILILISIIHFYWAFGGRWGTRAALPQSVGGGAVFLPPLAATIVVAVGILIFCF